MRGGHWRRACLKQHFSMLFKGFRHDVKNNCKPVIVQLVKWKDTTRNYPELHCSKVNWECMYLIGSSWINLYNYILERICYEFISRGLFIIIKALLWHIMFTIEWNWSQRGNFTRKLLVNYKFKWDGSGTQSFVMFLLFLLCSSVMSCKNIVWKILQLFDIKLFYLYSKRTYPLNFFLSRVGESYWFFFSSAYSTL